MVSKNILSEQIILLFTIFFFYKLYITYRKIISDDTGKPATGDELLKLVSKSYNNMIVQSRVFSDDEIDEAKKYVKESRMKNA